MNIRNHSKSSLFLLEILINLLFFSILLCICLRFFSFAHRKTNDAIVLEQAVTWCNNLAAIYQNSNKGIEDLETDFPNAFVLSEQVTLYLNRDFKSVSESQEHYYHIILTKDDTNPRLQQASIRFQDEYSNVIYCIDVSKYLPRYKLASKGGVADD